VCCLYDAILECRMFEIADPESLSRLARDFRSLTSDSDLDLNIPTLQLKAAVKADSPKRIDPITADTDKGKPHLSNTPRSCIGDMEVHTGAIQIADPDLHTCHIPATHWVGNLVSSGAVRDLMTKGSCFTLECLEL